MNISIISIHSYIGIEFMKITELRQKSSSELEKILQDSREKLRQLRFDLASGKVKNIREIRKVKKQIAQILTLQKATRHQFTN